MVDLPRARYVEIRRNRDGSERYVWNRKGFAARALPADRSAAMRDAEKLNNQAERGILRPKEDAERQDELTLARYLDLFEASDAFKGLAKQTKLNYRSAMKPMRETFPSQRLAAFQKRHIKRYLETIESLGMRRIAKSVFRSVFEMALDDEIIDRNPADNISLPSVKPRRQLWGHEQIDAFLAKCPMLDEGPYPAGRAEAMVRAIRLLEHTGQRPSDVLRMSWFHDDGEFIRVRQRKTGKLVEIYRGELGRQIDGWKESLAVTPASAEAPFATIVHGPDGRAYGMKWFDSCFRRVADAAGLGDLQARDLRRTAVTRLYEAGCSEGLISAITGHDIDTCRRILEHYFVRTREASKAAITRLDEHRARLRKLAAKD
jgi:integrase